MPRFGVAWFVGASLIVAGCAAPTIEDEVEGSTSSLEVVVHVDDVMARAQEWVNLRVPYCGGVRGGGDAICGGICNRPSAPWNGYRSDCSGFLSWAWQIPDDPATATYVRDRGGDHGWRTVAIADLRTGDAMVANGHIKLVSKMVGDGGAKSST